MVYKGKRGKLLEKYVLKGRFNMDYCPKNYPYDLPLYLNNKSNKNVSIKCSLNNTIYCSDLFNFLNSVSLELIIVSYKLANNNIKILNYYLFSELDLFFINLNNNIDLVLLRELKCYIKNLKYPFSKEERAKAHRIPKLVVKNIFYGFRVNVKLSKNNKRIQCSLKLDQLLEGVSFECLKLKTVIKLSK